MSRRRPAVLTAGALTALAAALLAIVLAPGAASGAEPTAPARRVLLVTYPATTWERVQEADTPVLDALVARSAIASMSVRTLGPTTSPGEAYVTIGAGNRAGVESATAGLALPPQASFEGDSALQVFERRCGCSGEGAAVLHMAMPRVNRLNEGYLYGAEPGALGTALAEAGHGVAVVGNADEVFGAVGEGIHREVALGVVDRQGRVPAGAVGPQLVVEDTTAPFGVRADVDAVASAVDAAWADADVVLLEMSDLTRVESYRELASDEAHQQALRQALASADELLGRVLGAIDLERDVVMVVGPTSPGLHRGTPQLTMAAFAGPSFEPGLLRSGTTRRAGFVTLPDVAPTILRSLDVELPSSMTGTIATSVGGGPPDADLVDDRMEDNEVAMFRDRATGPISVAFIVFQVITYGLAALALTRWRQLRPWVAFMALITLAQPAIAFSSRLVPYQHLGVGGYVVVFFAAGAALAVVALLVGRLTAGRTRAAAPLVPPLLLVGLGLVVLVVDLAAGGPLQLNTVFGYSPTVAGRFAGLGNLAFAMLASAAIVVATGVWGAGVLGGRRRMLPVAALVLVLAIVVDGLPSLGSDVGGVLALVPATAVILLLLAGRRVDSVRAVVIGVATVVVLAVFALIDLARPDASRTHLGRLAARLGDEGGGGVVTVLERKLHANISILTSSVWTWVIPVAIAFFAFLVWRRTGLLRALEERIPGLRACLVGALVAGSLGFALNDSGVAVPAMMLAVVLPYVTYLTVRTQP